MSSQYPVRAPIVPFRLNTGEDWNILWDWVSGSAVSPASYVVYSGSDGLYRARNGHTGLIEFSGSGAAVVIDNATMALTNGGIVHIKSGNYNLTDRIRHPDGVWIRGDGWGKTVLKLANSSTLTSASGNPTFTAVILNSNANVSPYNFDLKISDLTIDVNIQNQTGFIPSTDVTKFQGIGYLF